MQQVVLKNKMNLKYTIKSAISGLKANKSRSFLTILGIVIGITSIMLIMSVGSGAEELILNEFSGMGSGTIVIRPGKEPSGPSDFGSTLFSDSLKNKDIEALKRKSNVPSLIDVVPALIVPGSVSYLDETYKPTVFGWSAKFAADFMDIYPKEGRIFDESDIQQKAAVAVIGNKVKEELFGESDALGKNIKIKNKSFRVIGIYPKKGQSAFFNVDDLVLIPYSTAQFYLLGIDYFHEIMVTSDPNVDVNKTVRDIEATMRESHDITNPKDDDFFVVTQQGLIDQIGTIMSILTAFLSLVVAVSLVVGGIGVMNIMLVSVTERTKEIGLRKALGAIDKDIMTQFLIEAIILTMTGGIIGILLGTILSFVVLITMTKFLGFNWSFSFPFLAAFLGLGVSVIVGLVFGIYPAKQAAKKSPIEALRYE